MTNTSFDRPRGESRARVGLRLALAGVAAVACTAVAAVPASAASVTGGDADWGVKESFRNYIVRTGPPPMFPNGSIETSEGATVREDGTFDFQPGSGTYNPKTGAVDATFGGTVRFSGHEGALDFRLSDPRVKYRGDAGTLFADVVSKDRETGEVKEYPNVDFATLDLSGITPEAEKKKLTVTGVPATLTENGSPAFAGFYEPGAELDPISFSVSYTETAGKLVAGDKKQAVGSDRKVVLASANCAAASCTVAGQDRITAVIQGGQHDGKKVKAVVKAPKSVKSGKPAEVVAKLKRSSAKKLAGGGSAKLVTALRLKADGVKATKKRVSVKVKAG